MGYLTVKMSPRVRQMTLEEFLFEQNIKPIYYNAKETNTRTFAFQEIPQKYQLGFNIQALIREFECFNRRYSDLFAVEDRSSLYYEFYIPKKSGGLRKIDAPNDDLKRALRELKAILEKKCGVLYHTSAFAYIEGRCTLDALKRHQGNASKWYAKFDLTNFFGSTTLDFTMKMLSQVFPLSEIMQWSDGKRELTKAISLGFLNGGLPQGTQLSPTLTNIIMIPIDYEFNRVLREGTQKFVCTRYADDFIISSKKDFKVNEIANKLRGVLKHFDAPYVLKDEKTRYGSVAGQNWNLGLMINANNEITVGHKRKREFKAMLTNYIMDTKHGKIWDIHDVQTMDGLNNYYQSVEKETINEIINHIDKKFNVKVEEMIKFQLMGGVFDEF